MRTRKNESGVALIELMLVVAIGLIIVGIAVPSFISTQRNFRAIGDANNVSAEILLAKMRAASDFTQSRIHFDTAANTYQLELWDKVNSVWALDAPTGAVSLASGITLGFGAQTNQPPGTQAALAQAPACKPGTAGPPANPEGGADIANSACVVFNSRGIPIDNTASPTGNDAVYITDGKGVYAVTISATGLLKSWRIDVNDATAAHWGQR